MCGLLGVVSPHLTLPDERELRQWRERISHRGPDASGSWRDGAVAMAHCRLSVRDPESGAQPMTSADGRWVLLYNGELYNDAELRRELEPAGGWKTRSDTETVLAAIAAHGARALPRLRGMFALAAYDTLERRLLLARDPLGIKPLYWWCDGQRFVFGSEPQVVLGGPGVPVRPSLAGISAYLTTLRTTLGRGTMFDGVSTLQPGESLSLTLGAKVLSPHVTPRAPGAAVKAGVGLDEAAERLRDVLTDSTRRHLTSDVGVALMVSGGLDSAVLGLLATRHAPGLHGYTAGSAESARAGKPQGDLAHARLQAGSQGLVHHEVLLEGSEFVTRWRSMVHALGVPLSTPNEVAIRALSEALRADDHVVALSGEGSDELLGGYGAFMDAAASYCDHPPADLSGGRFHLEAGAWIPPAMKSQLLRPGAWSSLEDDWALTEEYDQVFARCEEEVGDEAEPLDAHLRFLRHVNLARLLHRLDTSTMLASVEGRTPFADVEVMKLCEELPMSVKFERMSASRTAEVSRTKRVLRHAFAGQLPTGVLERPKDSFSLPFQDWFEGQGALLRGSAFARDLFDPQILEAIAQRPGHYWKLAWPMLNVALWADRWF